MKYEPPGKIVRTPSGPFPSHFHSFKFPSLYDTTNSCAGSWDPSLSGSKFADRREKQTRHRVRR